MRDSFDSALSIRYPTYDMLHKCLASSIYYHPPELPTLGVFTTPAIYQTLPTIKELQIHDVILNILTNIAQKL